MLTVAKINSLNRAAFVAALGHLFEHSPWVAAETFDRLGLRSRGEAGPFRDAAHLHAELCATMRRASPERQLNLIRAHPDLAGRLAQEQRLTTESNREQASAGLNQLSAAERSAFQELNDAYHARFGFPFIICARLNAKDVIVAAMRARIASSVEVEFQTALVEIEKIAQLRLNDLLQNG